MFCSALLHARQQFEKQIIFPAQMAGAAGTEGKALRSNPFLIARLKARDARYLTFNTFALFLGNNLWRGAPDQIAEDAQQCAGAAQECWDRRKGVIVPRFLPLEKLARHLVLLHVPASNPPGTKRAFTSRAIIFSFCDLPKEEAIYLQPHVVQKTSALFRAFWVKLPPDYILYWL
ncbi:hypothetical protein NDU88_008651 [Pleurodeles waltl]|uniref:Uncharacterized protein n=1 Tax=Pleurodeles waltl TaxID=8319 RepID=A0AAV7QVB3_PLEWA|nr:hypothetical protein NDU88_008651 [Pleurodeles waltl]